MRTYEKGGFGAGLLAAALLTVVVTAAIPGTAYSSAPEVKLVAPLRAAVGEPIRLSVRAIGVQDIGGYEARLSFDTKAAHVVSVNHRGNSLDSLGRDVRELGPIELADGIEFGAYSCARADCVAGAATSARKGSGKALLARVELRADKPGLLQLRLSGARLVSAKGSYLRATSGERLVTVRIGSGTKRYRAPRAQSIRRGESQRVEVRDATGDGRLTEQDITEAALNWVMARERRAVCSIDRSIVDANGDGCVDVADVQAYAAAVTGASTSRLDATLAAAVDPPFVVNSTGDGADANPGNGTCLTGGGTCTLRAAIGEANARSGANTITFSIPGTGVQTIQLTTALPTLSDMTGATLIDGYSQPGAVANTATLADNAQLKIEVRGNGAFSNDGLTITSPGNTIRGIAFYNLHHSIFIFEQNATGNGVYGCFVGTDAAGTFGHTPSGSVSTAGNGVFMQAGAANNQVGGTSLADRNVISGNSRHGVVTYNAGSDNNTVYNNIIGLSPDGARRLSNLKHGIDINADSSFNVVGGTGAGMRNVISGNGGVDFDAGIEISHGPLTTGNQVVGNFIGSDLTGTTATSWTYNDNVGIRLEDSVKNTLVSDNVIVNNHSGGIKIDAAGNFGNVISNNRIGITLNGQAAANTNYGIAVGVGAINNRIGPGNIIANNAGIGVSIADASTTGITVTRNSIYNNNGLGIDLDPQWSVNPNDAGDGDSGPNGLLNYPVIASATTTAVSGSACAGCAIEVFVSDGDFRGAGEGKTHVGSATATNGGAFTAPVSGVSAGQKITASATDAGGNTSEFAINVTAQGSSATVPGAPTLTSANAGNGSVSLQWTPGSDGGATITNYNVYRSTQSGQEVFLTQLGNVTSYTNTGLTNGQIYWYKLSAVNTVGEGALSNERSATPQATVPGAPTLTSANAGNGSVSLQWTPPADGGSQITNYNVYRSTQSGQEVFLTQLGNVTSHTDTGLTNGQIYWYKVAAVNSVGVGALSNELSATPQATTVIVSDQFERSVAAGLGTADAGGSWSVTSTQRTKVVGGDAVIYGWSGGSQEVSAWMPTAASDMELLGLVKLHTANPVGASYQLRLMARAQADARNGYAARISHNTAGVASFGLARIDNAGGTGSLTLATGTLLPSGAAGSQWWIRLRVEGTSIKAKFWRNGTSEPAGWTAQATDSYWASGRASLGAAVYAGMSSPFPEMHFASLEAVDLAGSNPPPAATVPGAPTLTSATAGNGSVSLQWTPPADGGSQITNYNVYRSTQSGQEVFLTQLGNVTSYTNTGLTNGQTYWYKVSAVNAVGEGALSNELSATPQATATVPGAPTLTSATAGNGSVSLQWTPPADGGSQITNYNVYRSTQSGQEVFLIQLGNVTSYTNTGLTNGQIYWYKVLAVNAVGEGALSNELSATPQAAATVPGAPTLTNATAGNGSVSLQWTAPANGGSQITNYNVYRSTQSGQEVFLIQLGNVTSYTNTGLTNGQIYWYKVLAVNAVGEGALSNELSATPASAALPPDPPTNLTAQPASGRGVNLAWVAPSNNGGSPVTGYKIYRGGVLLTTVTTTSYKDAATTRQTTYSYWVTALTTAGESPPSNTASATAT